MALNADETLAKDAGWALPEGSDLIRHGDDAIRQNAVQAHKRLAEFADLGPVTYSRHGFMTSADKRKIDLYPDDPAEIPGADNGAKAAAKVALRDGTTTVMLMGDSTGNDANEWYRQWIEQLATETPALRVEYFPWEGTAYRSSPIIVQEGDGPAPPPVGGVVAADSFNREGELSGSTPDVGEAWTGTAGRWETENGSAVARGVGTAVLDGGLTSETMTSRALGVTMDLTPASAAKQFLLFTKYVNSLHHVYGYVNVSTTGVVTWGAFKRIDGTVTQIIPPQSLSWSGTRTFDMAITVDGSAVSLTVDGTTRTGTLTPSDVSASMSATALAMMSQTAATAGTSVASVELETPWQEAYSPNQVLYAYNASSPGSTLSYHIARLNTMLAPKPDLLILSSGHNYTTRSVEEYLDDVHAVVSGARSRYPEIGVAVSSQNAVSPDLDYYRHNIRRNAALRAEAHISGWGYIAGMEAFLRQPDDGADGLLDDGLHPSTLGSTWWKDAAVAYWRALTPNVSASDTSPLVTVDHTVGTRVMAGDTMIYGSTGWIEANQTVDVPTTGTLQILLHRENSTVTLSADRFTPAEDVGAFRKFMTLPPGFRPLNQYRDSSGYESGAVYTAPGGEVLTRPGLVAGESARFYIRFVTDDEWPAPQ